MAQNKYDDTIATVPSKGKYFLFDQSLGAETGQRNLNSELNCVGIFKNTGRIKSTSTNHWQTS